MLPVFRVVGGDQPDKMLAVGRRLVSSVQRPVVVRRGGGTWSEVYDNTAGGPGFFGDLAGPSVARRGNTYVALGNATGEASPGDTATAVHVPVSVSNDHGVTWSVTWIEFATTSSGDVTAQAIAANDDRFVLVVDGERNASSTIKYIAHSTDGVTWSMADHPVEPEVPFLRGFYTVTAGPDGFVAGVHQVGGAPVGAIWFSADGITWVSAFEYSDLAWTGTVRAVGYLKGKGWAALGWPNFDVTTVRVFTSPDGETWTHQGTTASGFAGSSPGGPVPIGLVGVNGYFVAALVRSASSRIIRSSDGITWSAGGSISGLAVGLGSGRRRAYVGTGETILSSPNGAAWSEEPPEIAAQYTGFVRR